MPALPPFSAPAAGAGGPLPESMCLPAIPAVPAAEGNGAGAAEEADNKPQANGESRSPPARPGSSAEPAAAVLRGVSAPRFAPQRLALTTYEGGGAGDAGAGVAAEGENAEALPVDGGVSVAGLGAQDFVSLANLPLFQQKFPPAITYPQTTPAPSDVPPLAPGTAAEPFGDLHALQPASSTTELSPEPLSPDEILYLLNYDQQLLFQSPLPDVQGTSQPISFPEAALVNSVSGAAPTADRHAKSLRASSARSVTRNVPQFLNKLYK
ncbi:MAG: hypothetical protein BJ554DRAFT_6827 [Olpidium bornovanus]|uniref:Uncharacterized protein n=1 Tax=Olpidium bornovanus TaxID=278681 RepID=A0A8H8DM99_9FUNG|nr:MAG: hypothetical protein BJ554DRAFT_6827 [Olpidium bornovanus]